MAAPTAVSPPDRAATASSPPNPIRARAYLLGCLLVPLLGCLSIYADMSSKIVQFGVLQLAPPAVVALFGLALLNRALGRRGIFNKGELIVIYAMCLLGVMVSTRGIIEKLVPPLAHLPYYATRENKLAESITQHLPAWGVPFVPSARAGDVPQVIADYYIGNGGVVPWNVWVGPLVAWAVLWACVLGAFACLATLLRRQWVENEQLRFPLTTLPLAMAGDDIEGQPFFSNRTMWAGFAVAFLVFGINGWAANNPDVPKFVTDLWLFAYFSERPYNAMDATAIYISLAAIGFAYFLPADLLFSLWFFFILTRVQDVFAVQMGGLPTGIGTHNARIWTGFQAAGAYLVLIAAQIRIGWPYFKQVWRTAFGSEKPLDDRVELMPYRAAILGLPLFLGGIILWLSIAGMHPLLAFAQMGIYLLIIAMIMSRAVAEAGLLMTETSFLPQHLISLVTPLSSLGPQNVAMLGLTNTAFVRDMRGVLLAPFMDAQKMAKESGLRARQLLLPLVSAVVISFVAGAAFFLWLSYSAGHLTLYQYPNINAGNMFTQAAAVSAGSGFKPDATAYGGFGVGIVVTLLLVWARGMFAWFPLHPLAYALAPTWTMLVFWFPFFVAWIVKSSILRFGGIDTYRKVAPFMLGMILGEFSSAVFFALGNMARGWNAPGFPWP